MSKLVVLLLALILATQVYGIYSFDARMQHDRELTVRYHRCLSENHRHLQ